MDFLERLENEASVVNQEPEWEYRGLDRMKAGGLQSVGTLAGLGSLALDSLGYEEGGDYFAEMTRDLFEQAADYELENTQFTSISNPLDFGKWAAETITSFAPDLAGMALGGGLASAGLKIAGKSIGKDALETMLHKGIANNLKEATAKGLIGKEAKEYAFKTTVGNFGRLVGMSGYEGALGAGGAYQYDRDLRGAEDASALAALGTGAAQSAVGMLSPFNRVLSRMGKGKGINLPSMMIGEAGEEAGQEVISLFHEAGVNPSLTLGELFDDPETAARLLESAAGGALLGGVLGGPMSLMSPKRETEAEKNARTLENPDSVLKSAGIDPDSGMPIDVVGKDINSMWEDYKGGRSSTPLSKEHQAKVSEDLKKWKLIRQGKLEEVQRLEDYKKRGSQPEAVEIDRPTKEPVEPTDFGTSLEAPLPEVQEPGVFNETEQPSGVNPDVETGVLQDYIWKTSAWLDEDSSNIDPNVTMAREPSRFKSIAEGAKTPEPTNLKERKIKAQSKQAARDAIVLARQKADIEAQRQTSAPIDVTSSPEAQAKREAELQKQETKKQVTLLKDVKSSKNLNGYKQEKRNIDGKDVESRTKVLEDGTQVVLTKQGSGQWKIFKKGKDTEPEYLGSTKKISDAQSIGEGKAEPKGPAKKGRPKAKVNTKTEPLSEEEGKLYNEAFSYLQKKMGDVDEDIKAEAILLALQQYNPDKGTTFKTFAYQKAKGLAQDKAKGNKENQFKEIELEGKTTSQQDLVTSQATDDVGGDSLTLIDKPADKVITVDGKTVTLTKDNGEWKDTDGKSWGTDGTKAKKAVRESLAPKVKKVEVSEEEKARIIKDFQESQKKDKAKQEARVITEKKLEEETKDEGKEIDDTDEEALETDTYEVEEVEEVEEEVADLEEIAERTDLFANAIELGGTTKAKIKQLAQSLKDEEVDSQRMYEALRDAYEIVDPKGKLPKYITDFNTNPKEGPEGVSRKDLVETEGNVKAKAEDAVESVSEVPEAPSKPLGKLKKYVADTFKFDMKQRAMWNIMQQNFKEELGSVEVFSKEMSENTGGYYDSGSHTIHLNPNYKGSRPQEEVVLHEAIHAISLRRLHTNEAYATKMHNLFDSYLLQTKDYSNAYGASNIYEFISEGLTNKNFQKELMEMEYKGSDKSMWDTFKSTLMMLWKPLKNNSVFEELFKTTLDPEGKDVQDLGYVAFKEMNQTRLESTREHLEAVNSVIEKAVDDGAAGSKQFQALVNFIWRGNPNTDELVPIIEEMNMPQEYKELLLEYTDSQNRAEKAYNVETDNETKELNDALKEFGIQAFAKDTPKTMTERVDIATKNSEKVESKTEALKGFSKVAADGLKDVGKGVTERLRKIKPSLVLPMRKMEQGISVDNKKYRDQFTNFATKYKRLSKRDKSALKLGLYNSSPDYTKLRNEVLERNGMVEEFKQVEGLLEDIHKEKGKEGLNKFMDVPEYYPRRVKDMQGLMEAMKGTEEYNKLQAQMDSLGEDASPAEREESIKKMIATGRFPSLALLDPGSSKKRKIDTISSEWLQFYEDPIDSMMNHIYESTEAIHSHRAFGDSTRHLRVAERDRLGKLLDDPKLKGAKRKKVFPQFQKLEEDLSNYGEDFNANGIAEQLAEAAPDLTVAEVDEVIKSIRARLTQKGMHGAPAAVRNLALMSVLGSPISAITQIGDLAFSIYDSGLGNTMKAMFGKNKISAKDLDLAGAMNEFQTKGTAAWLDQILKLSGLSMMDQFGKNTFMNAALKKAEGQTLEEFTKKWGEVYEGETEQFYNDIQSGVKNDNTILFAFNALSDFQPVSLSEMPVTYLQGGNYRIFYALKSYSVKAINSVYRESVHNIRTADNPKDKAIAAAKTGQLILLMTMMGATADELKDFLLGKDSGSFSESVKDNLTKTFLINRYQLEKGGSNMISNQIAGAIMPPMNLINDPISDILSWVNDTEGDGDWKTYRNLPWGKLPYSWLSNVEEYKDIRNFKDEIIESVKGGEKLSSASKKMREYNKLLRDLKEPRDLKAMNYGSLSRARKEYLKDK